MLQERPQVLLSKAIDQFIRLYSTQDLIELIDMFTESTKDLGMRDKYACKHMLKIIIRNTVCREFELNPQVIDQSGNDAAFYRGVCYYMHRRFDPSYSVHYMKDLYTKSRTAVRNGLENVEAIMNDPNAPWVDKQKYIAIVKIESHISKAKELLWQKQNIHQAGS